MRLDTLTIKGVLAFDEERALCFRDLPGLVALSGPNGEGKTTLMEGPIAATFRVFPSREKKEPFDYATRNDAFIQQTFELEGRGTYRARLNLDSVKRKQEAVLLRREPDGREVFVSDKASLASYDAAITELFPPLDDLLASVISVQTKRGSFSERDRKGKRELLYSLFGLDAWEVKAERARQASARVRQEIDAVTFRRQPIAADLAPHTDAAIAARTDALQVAVGQTEIRRVEVRRRITAAEDALAELEADARAFAAAEARHTRAQADVDARTADRGHVQTALDRAVREGQAERARLIARHEEWQKRNLAAQLDTTDYRSEVDRLSAALEDAVSTATRMIAENKRLIADDATIRAAAAELVDLDTETGTQTAAIKEAQLALDAAASADLILTKSLAEVERKEATLRRAETDSALLTTVPCHGDAEFAACPFLTNAQQAKRTIVTLTEAIAMKDTLLAEQRQAHARRDLARAARTAAQDAITGLARRRATIKPTADRFPYLIAAHERITALEQRKTDAHAKHRDDLRAAVERSAAQVAKLQREAEHREHEHAGTLTVHDQRHAEDVSQKEAQLARLRDAIDEAALEREQAAEILDATRDAAHHATSGQATLTTYRAEWDEVTHALATAQAQVTAHVEEVRRIGRLREQLTGLDARIAQLTRDLTEWEQLASGCGRDGVPTLEIDAAGPRLTTLFNDLLHATYGGRFTGELVTQAKKVTTGRDGSTHKEVVEFKIYDQRRGGAERDLGDLSGGQKVVVEEVLRNAIALLVNERSPFPMRTCFRDETTGALDPAAAVRYVALLRRVMELGGFHQVLFVTHSEHCKRLADAQVVVGGGDFKVLYPPYAQEPDPDDTRADGVIGFEQVIDFDETAA
jgi:exonuclease SbcC